jgi:hypothetical protein
LTRPRRNEYDSPAIRQQNRNLSDKGIEKLCFAKAVARRLLKAADFARSVE